MNTLKCAVCLVILYMLAVGFCEDTSGPCCGKVGLYIENGVLTKDGKPYRGIGANYFSLFYRTLKDPNDTSYKQGLQQLSKGGIPFVRFMCSGFWPVDNELYLKNRQIYFQLLDNVVKAAEDCNVGLIPSLFCNISNVPDIVG